MLSATRDQLEQCILRRKWHVPGRRAGRKSVEQLRLPCSDLWAAFPRDDLDLSGEWPKTIRFDKAGHHDLVVPSDTKFQGLGIAGEESDREGATLDGNPEIATPVRLDRAVASGREEDGGEHATR